MPKCPSCGGDPLGSCLQCGALYEEDILKKHIPPEFVKAGEDFTFLDWRAIRGAERKASIEAQGVLEQQGVKVTKQAIQAYVNAAAAKEIENRLDTHRVQRAAKARDAETPAQRAARQIALIRSRYTY